MAAMRSFVLLFCALRFISGFVVPQTHHSVFSNHAIAPRQIMDPLVKTPSLTVLHEKSPKTSFELPTISKENQKSILSAATFCLMHIILKRIFLRLDLTFPSSLAGCGFVFAALLLAPEDLAKEAFDWLNPGAKLLAKWLPVFFVPSLVTLPLAGSIGSAVEIFKVATVIVGGFFFTLLTTAGSVVGVRRFISKNDGDKQDDTISSDASEVVSDVEDVASDAAEAVTDAAQTFAEKRGINTNDETKVFSDDLLKTLVFLTVLSAAGAVAGNSPLTPAFMLFTTLTSFVFGTRLPKKVTKLIHPLITCTALTWATLTALAAVRGSTFRAMLRSYTTGTLTSGAGDLLLFLLGPSVVSFAISMYEKKKLMRDNLAEVVTGITVSTFGGLFGTALFVRLLAIGNPSLRLSLLSRNITSPLAMSIAAILGADTSLAVSMVVITGVLGANFGAAILDATGINDAVARGLSIGAAAHGLGTASFANEKDAFPFAAISMALTASAATVCVSIAFFRRMLLQLALGW